MEMVIIASLVALDTMCTVACLVILLAMVGTPAEKGVNELCAERTKTAEELADVEKRRRAAVEARQNQNFMDYDGTVQNPIDSNLILADGG